MARVEGCSVAAIFSSRKGRLLRLITRSISDVMTNVSYLNHLSDAIFPSLGTWLKFVVPLGYRSATT